MKYPKPTARLPKLRKPVVVKPLAPPKWRQAKRLVAPRAAPTAPAFLLTEDGNRIELEQGGGVLLLEDGAMALTPRLIIRMPAPALRGSGSIDVSINANWLDSVRFIATSGTLASDFNTGDVYDGLTIAAGDSFLYQVVTGGVAATNSAHGIYVAGAGAPLRRADADSGAELLNAAVVVRQGSGAGQAWICVNTTAPVVGTDGIVFRLMGTGIEVASATLATSAGFATYADQADVVTTAGYATALDGGGMTWKRGTATMPSTLTYFRKQDAGGTWYEAVSKRTIMGESIGIYGAGSGSNVGPNINEAIAWLGGKGGGRIVLPPGVCSSDIDLLCDTDGIWIQGTATGPSSNTAGTHLRLATGCNFHIGTAGGTQRYAFKCSDMTVTQDAASTEYFFVSHNVRNMRFRDLQMRNCYGFLKAGDQINDSTSRMIFMEGIEGNLNATNSANFIEGTNIGAFFLSNVIVEGAPDPIAGQTFVNLPNHKDSPAGFTQNRADGCIITGCGASRWDYGIKIQWGIANFFVSNTWLDGCETSALWIASASAVNGLRFNNCHFSGFMPPSPTAIGINISEVAENITRIEISDSHILNFGRSGLRTGNNPNSSPSGISILNNQFEDNCSAVTDGTESVVYIGGNTHLVKVSGNQIYKNAFTGDLANKPKYGINIQTDTPLIEVINNAITDVHSSGATVTNPFRGPAATRKIYGNSGQVLEGQVIAVGPWIATGLTATATDVPLTLSDIANLAHAVILRRGQVLSISARANIPVTGGSVTFRVTKNGTNTSLLCTSTASAETYAEDLAGIDFIAGDQLGVSVTTSAVSPTTTINWAVFLNIIYD